MTDENVKSLNLREYYENNDISDDDNFSFEQIRSSLPEEFESIETNLYIFPAFDENNGKPQSQYEDISDDEISSSNSESSITLNTPDYPVNIEEWDATIIMRWILDLYDRADFRYEDLNVHYFKDKNGSYLINLPECEWNKIDKKRGEWLFQQVQELIKNSRINTAPLFYETNIFRNEISDEEANKNLIPNFVVRKRGRPKKPDSKPRNKEKVGRIWEFLRDLLKDPENCPKYIRWENFNNLEFRLVDGKKISEIWGQKKNKTISYEHFSRSIRHYYPNKNEPPQPEKEKIVSVPDKRLVYKFSKEALTPADYEAFVKYNT